MPVPREPYVVIDFSDTGADRPASDLAVIRHTIEAHRGQVWHRRQPGGGTCVIIELPAAGPRH
jgi:hypothetical protein